MLLYGQVKMFTLCRYPHTIHLLYSAKVFYGIAESYIIRSCSRILLRRTLSLIIRHLPAYVTDATGAQGGTRTRTAEAT